MLEVTRAEYIDGYRIRLEFSNGESGIVDLADSLWGPVFEPLRDIEAFRQFTLSPVLHTICWDNDADLAPEYLYAKMLEQTSTTTASPLAECSKSGR
jgi:hypothetical protein